MSCVRTRISPSPSGSSIHIGNLKTGIFNYIFAKKHGGTFYYRVEDTDQERVVEGAAQNILNDLRWAGITPTEGYLIGGPYAPYSQMERLGEYKKYINYLLEKGYAYKCYCSSQDLDKQREEALKSNPKAPFKYPGTCRNLNKDLDKPFVIRFKAPTDGVVEFEDLIFGKRVIPNKENYDFVIARENGIPLYNAACVFDDISHHTTHIIRGADHIKNCPSQILIYQALGANIPKLAHLTMILNSEGNKLSKRDNAVSVAEYRSAGYSPQALCNYLLRFGWGFGNKEVFKIDDIVDIFDFKNCGKNDGKFDAKKFAAIQYEHLQKENLTSTPEYASRVIPFLQNRGLTDVAQAQVEAVIPLIRHKCKTLIDAAHELDPILRKEISIEPVAAEKFLTTSNKEKLQNLGNYLTKYNADWSEQSLKDSIKDWLDNTGLILKDIKQPIRVATIGRTTGPELFQGMIALGKETTINRLMKASNG